MRILVLPGLLLLSLLSGSVVAQGEANNWYFGSGAGLTFSDGAPRVLTDGVITVETNLGTTAVVSDASGRMLFYTQGQTVWNRLHQPMPYGKVTSDGYTATQVVAVPLPGSDRYYFIFRYFGTGLMVVRVDMTLDGGLGDIDQVQIMGEITTGALSAVRHQNGVDIWVVVQGDLSGNHYAYLLTREGIFPQPVVSQLKQPFTPQGGFHNRMKFSPDGRKLVSLVSDEKLMQVFDFNAETGQLTNPVSFPVGEAGDMEIYPCPLLLYTGEENNFYQYDLRGGDAKAILRSKTLIAEKPDVVEGKAWPGLPSLQLGPDGKIYIGVPYSSDLHVIPRPGVVGTGCGFQPRAIDLQGGYVFQGLTCFMRSYLIPDGAPVVEMPNVFTPDGDQLNATFRPISLENVTDPQLSVYNRWGRLVHQSTGAQLDWDGKDHPAGTYYWLLLYAGSNTTDCGRRYSMKGFVSLIR